MFILVPGKLDSYGIAHSPVNVCLAYNKHSK